MKNLIKQYNQTTNREIKNSLFQLIFTNVEKIFISLCMKSNVASHSFDDVRQEVMEKLWRVLPSYDADRANFTTFFYRVADNVIKDYQRLQNRRNMFITHIEQFEQGELAVGAVCEEYNEFEFAKSFGAIRTITPSEKEIAILLMQGYSKSDIAEMRGTSKAAVTKACQKIRIKYMQDQELAQADSSFLFLVFFRMQLNNYFELSILGEKQL
ncbi:RNA polymerase sigma factor [Desulfuribacillus alkaliarsenatis]|uniref:RNA polymerase sigma factor SigS n=1 Tax=Desulfuribacillus alkaliarsenatis TaxID=766136 RepID=A0A1E5G6I7_9FIRM|nr:RNA polymerase sigma factor [Desulfuribacillus alkaliarsenatis]OEF98364.1 hypothetical protein BHF68_01420 [Desulfuribacillus alkaliarsenatis]